MLSTAISVQFIVNDLDAAYEIIGTSDNYSFSHNFGRGDTLVDFKGAIANKVISLEGNYGIFEVKLFAVNQVGIRSAFIKETVSVKPPRFSGSFLFSEIKINDLPEDSKIGAKVKQYPSLENGKLIVDSEYVGRDIEFAWKLTAPAGHVLEGQSLDYDLINDSFLSGFNIELYNDGQKVDFSNLDPTSDAVVNLAADLNTEPGNIDDILLNYKQFDFNISQETFDSLNLSRNLSLNVVAVDYFGNTSTGLINAKNYSPTVFNFTNSLSSSRMSFSWSEGDTDYSGIKIDYLSIPSDQELYNSLDLEDSRNYYQKISQAKNYDSINGANYTNGEMILYSDGLVYECINSHTRQGSASAPGNTTNWKLIGDTIDYQSEEIEINGFSFGIDQKWGHSYYYQLQPHDNYGAGETFNLTETSLVTKGNAGSDLKPFFLEIKLSNIEFREQEDDFFFDWEVLDQDNNAVDIDKYRFPLSNADLPSILGISGSLFDADTNVFLSGITEGYNSRSVTVDQNGNEVINESLPTAKNFSSFLYTRELNNAIYGTGGWISDYGQYDNNLQYNMGDVVLADNNLLYESLIGDLNFEPIYDAWQKSKNYSVADVFQYQNNVIKCIADFGPETISSYNESSTYSVGDIVIAPNSAIRVFNSSENYSIGTEVLYQGGLYTAVRSMASSSPVTPGTDLNYWSRISFFSSIESAYFKLTNDSNPEVPFLSRNHWQIVDPKKLSDQGLYFEVIVDAYIYDISNWSSENQYNKGDFVVYSNDIWSGVSSSLNEIPSVGSQVWSNTSNGEDIGTGYQQGDLVFSNGVVYQCSQTSPTAGPIEAFTDSYQDINSSYAQSNWLPVWENKSEYDNFVFKHVGIPESGKRSVGIEVGIIDTDGNIIDKKTKIAINPAPAITDNGFSKEKYKEIESTEETTKVKFRFNYTDEGKREKTTKVNLYRSEVASFSILNADGLPFESLDETESTLVKTVIGAADASLGTNINQIIDTPPVYVDEDGIESRKGWFYKILPFDDFGSGYLYEYDEKILVWPRNYSDQTENGISGPVISLTEDAIPQGVLNFNGDTAFTTYFLHWNMPNSQVLENDIISVPPNDLSHYEVWLSTSSQVLQKSNQDFEKLINDDGYRRVIGDVKSSIGASENIPPDAFDPGLSITNAKNIFNVPASSPSVETSYIGNQGDTGFFWVRAVDKAGNKSPFVGAEDPNSNYVDGLKLELAGVETTDLVDFQKNLTEEFKNTIALDPPNPFVHNAGELSWAEHDLWLNGNKYDISAGSLAYLSSGYVWWDFGSAEYSGNNTHPGGSDGFDALEGFNDGDFIVAKNSAAGETLAYEVFANALIGTAQISELAVTDAKIQTLTADKITAGQIKGHRIEVFHSGEEGEDPNIVEKSKYGSVASAGFSGLVFSESEEGVLDSSQNGFVLSGDGSFAFQQGKGGLSFEDDELTIRGRLRQKNNKDYDFVDIDFSSSFVNYLENEDGFILDSAQSNILINLTFRNSSVSSANDIQIKIKDEQDEKVLPSDISTEEWIRLTDLGSQAGFTYNDDWSSSNGLVSASITMTPQAFDNYIKANSNDSELITIFVKSVHSDLQKRASISRLIDGKAAESIRLTAASQIFKVNKYGALEGLSEITITADRQNTQKPIRWTSTNSVQIYDSSNNVINQSDYVSNQEVKIKFDDFGANKNTKIRAETQAGAVSPSVFDEMTFIVVDDGSNEVGVVLSNENHTLSQISVSNSLELNPTDSGTDIEVFDGAQLLTPYSQVDYNDLTDKKGAYYVTDASTTGITEDSNPSEDSTSKKIIYGDIVVDDHTVTSASITFTISGTKLNGEAFGPIDKKQTFSVAQIGEDGKTAVAVELSSTHYAIRYSIDPANENNLIADPQSFTLTATPRNLEVAATYEWKKNGTPIPNESGGQLDNQASPSVTDGVVPGPITYSVEISVGPDVVASDSITIISLKDGNIGRNGRTPTYRGNWTSLLEELDVGGIIKFEQTDTRGDIVEFNTNGDNYWICTTPHWIKKVSSTTYSFSDNGSNFGAANILSNAYWIEDSSYWNENWTNFGTELDNVATDILLTKEAYITNKLNLGGPKAGAIKSNGFIGGLIDTSNEDPDQWAAPPDPENYNPAGFVLAYDNNSAYFDVGGRVKSSGDDISLPGGDFVKSYMRFDSSRGKLEIRGASVNNTSEEQIAIQLSTDQSSIDYGSPKDTLATFVGGGYSNNISDPNNTNSYQSLASSIIGGGNNSIEGRFSMIGNGFSNDCKDNFSAIVAGYNNSMPQGGPNNQGSNFIGAGQNNVINGGTNQAILAGQNNQIIYTL